jgi:rare lipoprotein A (peptidoglycan hydrolase)
MSKSSSKHRYLPAAAGLMVSLTGLGVVGGVQVAASQPGDAAQVADRQADSVANRGSGRTHVPLDEAAPTSVPATESIVTSVVTAVAPTTTEAPTTTTAPSTTTVAPATTTTTAVRQAKTGGAHVESGGASYYAYKSGGCAHKTIPKGTVVTVTNASNGKSATCVVNDRGPFVSGRIIDLDTSVFRQVASTSSGVFQARISW